MLKHLVYVPVMTTEPGRANQKNRIFFPAQLSVCFVWFSEYRGIILICCINVTETQFVVYEVETELIK